MSITITVNGETIETLGDISISDRVGEPPTLTTRVTTQTAQRILTKYAASGWQLNSNQQPIITRFILNTLKRETKYTFQLNLIGGVALLDEMGLPNHLTGLDTTTQRRAIFAYDFFLRWANLTSIEALTLAHHQIIQRGRPEFNDARAAQYLADDYNPTSWSPGLMGWFTLPSVTLGATTTVGEVARSIIVAGEVGCEVWLAPDGTLVHSYSRRRSHTIETLADNGVQLLNDVVVVEINEGIELHGGRSANLVRRIGENGSYSGIGGWAAFDSRGLAATNGLLVEALLDESAGGNNRDLVAELAANAYDCELQLATTKPVIPPELTPGTRFTLGRDTLFPNQSYTIDSVDTIVSVSGGVSFSVGARAIPNNPSIEEA